MGSVLRLCLGASALVLIGLPAGCANAIGGAGKQPGGRPTSQVTAHEAWLALSNFQDTHEEIVRDASRRMMDQATDNRMRRHILEWKIYGLRLMRNALKKDEPIAALLDAWALAVQMKQFNQREAAELPPESRSIMLEAADATVAEIEKVVRHILHDADFESVREQIYRFAAEHSVSGGYSTLAPQPPSQAAARIPVLDPLLRIPMAPFRTAEGIDRGAQAIYEFTKVAMRFTDVVEGLPEESIWQMQLLLLDLSENEVVQSLLASSEQISESTRRFVETSDRLADTLATMPQDVRRETQELLNELTQRQAELQATLDKIEASAKAIDSAVNRVRETTPEVTQAVQSTADAGQKLAEAAGAIQDMVASFRTPSESGQPPPATLPAGPDEPGRSFDIREYDAAAQSVAEAARELQALTGRVTDLDERLTAHITRAAGEADAVAARLVWRLAALAVFVFALALVYRWLSSRRPGRNT
jgi:hypothetical protein